MVKTAETPDPRANPRTSTHKDERAVQMSAPLAEATLPPWKRRKVKSLSAHYEQTDLVPGSLEAAAASAAAQAAISLQAAKAKAAAEAAEATARLRLNQIVKQEQEGEFDSDDDEITPELRRLIVRAMRAEEQAKKHRA